MEIIKQLPKYFFESVQDKAIRQLSVLKKPGYYVGMHTVRMNINGVIRKTIIPPLYLYTNGLTEKGVDSRHIDYRIAYDGRPFPFSHVFGKSGWLCLGDIPVPYYVSPYDLMSPLETLFLYNDRNVNHGGAKLKMTANQSNWLTHWADSLNLQINTTKPDLIPHDTLWDLNAQLLEKYPIDTAYQHAEELFQAMFPPKAQKGTP